MDPNLLKIFASGAFPSPLPSPQETLNMVIPMQLNPQLIQQELLRQMACQQLLYQQTYSTFLVPTVPAPVKAVSPIVIAELPRTSSVTSQTLAAALASPTVVLAATTAPTVPSPESPKTSENHCVSPSTSSSQTKDAADDDEDLFVDVESVDSKVANKDRRKAHVEFFRKIKSIRQRAVTDSSGERFLQCAICNDKVPMQDNAIQLHVNLHADAGGYRCQLCGLEMKEKAKLYTHMRQKHPNKVDLIEDRRNINKLSAYIEVVFPKACAKTKKDSTKEVEQLIKHLEERKMPEVACSVCEKMVALTRHALTRHANSHPWYRCKSCKYTTDNEKDQEQHQIREHAVSSPRLTAEYNLTTAIEIVARQVSRCFSHAMQ